MLWHSTEVPAAVTLVRMQALRYLNQVQDAVLDGAEWVVRLTKASPVSELPAPSKIPGIPSLDAATQFTFDFAAEVLNSHPSSDLRLTRALRSK